MGLRFGLPVRAIAKVLILCALFWKVSGMLELRRDVAPHCLMLFGRLPLPRVDPNCSLNSYYIKYSSSG